MKLAFVVGASIAKLAASAALGVVGDEVRENVNAWRSMTAGRCRLPKVLYTMVLCELRLSLTPGLSKTQKVLWWLDALEKPIVFSSEA